MIHFGPTPLVFYHAPCADGFTAAWVLRRAFPRAELRPAQYMQTPLPADVDGREVILVDFSWDVNEMEDLYGRAEKLLVLDHHESAVERLQGLQAIPATPGRAEFVLDMQRSGARLAWDYFNAAPAPDLVRYVEDRDLWRWALPQSRAYSAVLRSHPFDFNVWTTLAQRPTKSILDEGENLLRLEAQIVKGLAAHARAVRWMGFTTHVVNTAAYQSEVGEYLYELKGAEVAMAWFQTREGQYKYSLRSGPEGPNVRVLAQHYGGGGHAHAAGFTINEPLTF